VASNVVDSPAKKTFAERDLDAQESMASSARWQLYLTIATLLGLVLTVFYTRQQVKDAREQLRAHVSKEMVSFSEIAGGYAPTIHITLKNTGATAARNFKCWGNFDIYGSGQTLPSQPLVAPPDDGETLASGSTSTLFIRLSHFISQQDAADVYSGIAVLAAQCEVTYDDAFGESHHLAFNLKTYNPNGMMLARPY
jgi:hypothetical protein